jgi:hypothetical protein
MVINDPEFGMWEAIIGESLLMFLRFRRLYLTCLEELKNWGFVGGSIDSLNYPCICQ